MSKNIKTLKTATSYLVKIDCEERELLVALQKMFPRVDFSICNLTYNKISIEKGK